jgi:hypothetical protein
LAERLTMPQAYAKPRRVYSKPRSPYKLDNTLEHIIPTADPPTQVEADECQGSIIDTAPDGSGLGVWVLVKSDRDSCTYEYSGGIA